MFISGFESQMCTLTIPTICTTDTVTKVVGRIKQWCDFLANNSGCRCSPRSHKTPSSTPPFPLSAINPTVIRHHQKQHYVPYPYFLVVVPIHLEICDLGIISMFSTLRRYVFIWEKFASSYYYLVSNLMSDLSHFRMASHVPQEMAHKLSLFIIDIWDFLVPFLYCT